MWQTPLHEPEGGTTTHEENVHHEPSNGMVVSVPCQFFET
jgi:hypothetical protein